MPPLVEVLPLVIPADACWQCGGHALTWGPCVFLPGFLHVFCGPLCGFCVLSLSSHLAVIDRHLRN